MNRCKQCDLENNNGRCDRKDCINYFVSTIKILKDIPLPEEIDKDEFNKIIKYLEVIKFFKD